MIRISEAQARLLFEPTAAKGAPRVRKPRADLPENQLESQIRMYLGSQGWTVLRRHVGTFVPYHAMAQGRAHANVVRIGEPGESDWLCSRPTAVLGQVQQFSLETKAPGARPSQVQELWMLRQRAGGFIAVWFDDFGRFQEWYKAAWSKI